MGWAGLSPRPATAKATDEIVEDPETIGYAVTSGSNPHRRSRSLGELQHAALKNGIVRRRSDEIRYWRESYEPGPLSPLSSNRPDGEEQLALDNVDTPQDETHTLTPAQPFNFGPLVEMAGMKITEAASLETRVSSLEAKLLEMERAMVINSKLGPKSSAYLQDPRRPRSDNDYSSFHTGLRTESSDISLPRMKPSLAAEDEAISPCHSRPTTKSTNDPYEATFGGGHPDLDATPRNLPQIVAPRPLSTSTTIRGLSSSSPGLPVPSKDGLLTAERYNALTSMIIAEHEARKRLETIVEGLQAQIRAMHLASSHSHPTESPDLREEGASFNGFEQDNATDDGSQYKPNEIFETPSEEKAGFAIEEFGVNPEPASLEDREAVRTMSLGEITLGKRLQRV